MSVMLIAKRQVMDVNAQPVMRVIIYLMDNVSTVIQIVKLAQAQPLPVQVATKDLV